MYKPNSSPDCKKMLQLSLLLLFFAALPGLGFAAQPPFLLTEGITAAKDSNDTKKEKDYAYQKSWALGVQAGLPGVGAEVAYNLSQHLNLRLRGSYFAMSDYQIKYEANDQPLSVGLDADLLAVDLLLEYLPFKKSSFKLIAGASYFSSFDASTVIMLDGNTAFGDIELEPDQVGFISLENSSAGLAPYAGIGFGRAVPKRRVGVSLEMGSYYLQKPDITMDASGLLEPNASAEQEQKFEDAFSSFRWLPHMMLKIAVRLD